MPLQNRGAIECGLGIDAFDEGGAGRTAHDVGVVNAGHLDIVHIGGGAGDEARVFGAADALADYGALKGVREYQGRR